jgi:hypothetical protein
MGVKPVVFSLCARHDDVEQACTSHQRSMTLVLDGMSLYVKQAMEPKFSPPGITTITCRSQIS